MRTLDLECRRVRDRTCVCGSCASPAFARVQKNWERGTEREPKKSEKGSPPPSPRIDGMTAPLHHGRVRAGEKYPGSFLGGDPTAIRQRSFPARTAALRPRGGSRFLRYALILLANQRWTRTCPQINPQCATQQHRALSPSCQIVATPFFKMFARDRGATSNVPSSTSSANIFSSSSSPLISRPLHVRHGRQG